MTGIDLLSTDDTMIDMVPIADHTLPTASIPPATRRAMIVEKANGDSDQIIALRYDVDEASVRKVWKDWVAATIDVRRLGDENPEIFKAKIRKKAINAIENGLDCDRDPYRQGALGVQVMKGIGEFKGDEGRGDVKVNVLVGAVPAEWKDRYVSVDSSYSEPQQLKGE